MKILLHIVSEHTSEENNFIQRAGIFLLNSLACQVDGQQKMLVGSLGAMEKMLFIITNKLQQGVRIIKQNLLGLDLDCLWILHSYIAVTMLCITRWCCRCATM